jgi:hypothetical protein
MSPASSPTSIPGQNGGPPSPTILGMSPQWSPPAGGLPDRSRGWSTPPNRLALSPDAGSRPETATTTTSSPAAKAGKPQPLTADPNAATTTSSRTTAGLIDDTTETTYGPAPTATPTPLKNRPSAWRYFPAASSNPTAPAIEATHLVDPEAGTHHGTRGQMLPDHPTPIPSPDPPQPDGTHPSATPGWSPTSPLPVPPWTGFSSCVWCLARSPGPPRRRVVASPRRRWPASHLTPPRNAHLGTGDSGLVGTECRARTRHAGHGLRRRCPRRSAGTRPCWWQFRK